MRTKLLKIKYFESWHMRGLSTSLNSPLNTASDLLNDQVLQAAEDAKIGLWSTDLKAGTSSCNAACAMLFGEETQTDFVLQDALTKHVQDEDFEEILQTLETVAHDPNRRAKTVTFRLTQSDQSQKWLRMSITAAFDDDTNVPSHLTAVFQDVSEEFDVREHNERLVKQMQHRVKNILSVVQSVAYQSFRHDLNTSGLFSDFQGRLRALAKTQDLLLERRFEGAKMEDLTARIIESCGASAASFKIRGFSAHLGSKQAVSMGIVLHELVINALKYGSLSIPTGQVELTWDRNKLSEMVRIQWVEHGGPTVIEPSEKGFGTRMIERAIALEFGGAVSFEFEPDGVRCVMTVPYNSLDQDRV